MSEEKTAAVFKRGIIYRLYDKPKPVKAFILALQHVLTMFGATVSVPLLLGPVMGMTGEQIAILVSSVMLCSGIATLLQVTIGSRLPIIQGVSFSFLGPFFAIIAFAKTGELSMQYIAGAIILGSFVEMVIGWTGLIGKLRKFLSPVVIGPVIMLIGLALFQVGAPKAGTYWPISGIVIILILFFSQFLARKMTFFKIFPIISAIAVGYLICVILSLTGAFQSGHPAHINFGTVVDSPWIKSLDTIILPWGMPKFHIGFFFAVLAGYLASTIESFGDYHAAAYISGAGEPTPKMLNRGIGSEGLGCFITGILGGFSSTSYSENIGLVGITKVASLYVVKIGAVILLVLGLFSKFGAFVATIPEPIVGALYCALFGLISAIGIQQLSKADLSSERNLMIAGFTLFMGLSVPAYFSGVPVLGYTPGMETISALLPKQLADIVNSIGSTGMAVAAIIGLILDNIIPGTDEERGIAINTAEKQ